MLQVTKLRKIGVKFISTNPSKRTIEVVNSSKRDDYYKHLGEAMEKSDFKPPGWDEALPFESIPGPKPLPLIRNLWRFLPYIGEFHNMPMRQIYQTLKDRYGNTVILKGIPGRKPIVILYDVNDMETALRNEGVFPVRSVLETIAHYRLNLRKDIFSEAAGVLSLQGEDWFKFRSVMNPVLMQPRVIQQYVGSMDKVANELVENMRYFSKQNENSEMPENFQDELYKWALESVGVVALDRHLGCLNLNDPQESETHKFIANVNQMFQYMYEFDILPPIWKFIETPSFKRYMKILDYLTEATLKYTEESLNKLKDVSDDQLSVIQRLGKIDKKIAAVTGMDLLTAGIDTTNILTMHIISSNSELFKEPEKFIPERWLRTTKDEYSVKNVHPFAYMPFGFGPRSCIGMRLANLEVEVALLKIIRNFELSWHHEDMLFSGKLLYGIVNPLKVRVKEL